MGSSGSPDNAAGAYHMGGAEGLNYPPGCQKYIGNSVYYFNTNSASKVVCSKANKCLCTSNGNEVLSNPAAVSLLIPDESPSKPYLPRTDGLCTVDGRSYIGTKEDCTKGAKAAGWGGSPDNAAGAYHMGGAEGLNYPPGCQKYIGNPDNAAGAYHMGGAEG